MAASATDYYTKVGNPGTATTLAAPGHTIAGTTFNVVSTTNWPTTTGVIFAVDNYTLQTINGVSTAVRTAGTYTEWEGVVASSTQITGATLLYGTDQNYSAGSLTRVYIPVASSRENRIVDGLTAAGLNQDGTQTPVVKTSINDTNGNKVIRTPATTSAVNDVTVTNAATGNAPSISASGSDATANLNLRGKGLAKTVTIGAGAATIFPYDYVVSGCVLSGTGYGSTLAWSMTSGVVVINGNPVTVASATGTVTASKDTYFDVLDNGDGTGLLVNTSGNIVANNAASPALASNSIRIGIIVSGVNIAAATSVNQGQETMVLPIVSSIPYAVTDSLGNLICPRDPNRKILGYRQAIATQGSVTADVVLTALTTPVIIPTNRKVKITVVLPSFSINAANAAIFLNIRNGTTTGGTLLGSSSLLMPTVSTGNQVYCEYMGTTTSGSQSFVATASTSSGTGTLNSTATVIAFIKVELV